MSQHNVQWLTARVRMFFVCISQQYTARLVHVVSCCDIGNESCVFQYDPETERSSMVWKTKSFAWPQKFRLQISRIKAMIFPLYFIRTIFLTDKQWITCWCWQGYRKECGDRVTSQLVRFVRQCRYSFRHDGEAPPGESQRSGLQLTTLFTWPRASRLSSVL